MKKYIVLKLILVLFFFIPKTTYAQGPELTATGNQIYCGDSKKIIQTVSITDPSATTTDASVYIQIATNYEDGEDLLTLLGTHSTISSTWSEQEGKLTLSPSNPGGTVSYAELEAAILDVEFITSSTTTGEKLFTILLGVGNRELSYLPRNGHYYEYVSDPGITWTAARILAETYAYRGLQGYLVTLTAEDEQQIAGIQAPGAGWIGATDEAVEGDWRWVTGPEGTANGNTGTLFSKGTGCIGCGFEVATPDGEFSFWNNNNAEPNAANAGEDYAHIVSPLLTGAKTGTWNDMPVGGTPSGVYQPKGFIVEYGGMLGDTPEAPILATISIIIPDIIYYPNRSATICPLGTATFTGVPTNLPTSTEVYWYDDPTSATPIWTGRNFETPELSTTTTFYSDNGCLSQRKSFTVTVDTVPTLTISPVAYTYDQNDTATPLSATASSGCTLNWYDATEAIIPPPTPPTPSTAVVGVTTYFVSQTLTSSGCEGSKIEITVTVNGVPVAPDPPVVANISYCQNETALALTATASSNCTLNWYTTATGGTSTATSPTPSTTTAGTTSYFVSQTDNSSGLESIRAEIQVTINSTPTLVITNPVGACLPSTVDLTANSVSSGSILEGGVLSYWTDSAATTVLSNPNAVAVSGTYYIKAETSAGCLDIKPVTVTVSDQPELLITNPAAVCSPATIDLTAAAVTTGSTLEGGSLSYWTDAAATAVLSNPNAVTASGMYYIKVETTAGCMDIKPVTVTINPLPNIDLNFDGSGDEIVCSDNTSFSFTLDAGIKDNTPTSAYSYIWSKDGSVLPDKTPTLDVYDIGAYTVEVINSFGCSEIRTITIKTAKTPIIDTIEIVGLSTNNSVTVILEEPGDFQYTIDNPNGFWQDSNVFSNVSGGEHTVYVRDKFGCLGDSRVIIVISVPKFFTPNNDSDNDYWNVKGLSKDDSKSIVYIFDRYGKLLKQWIPSLELGWDGTYNGAPLPSNDYWYVLKMENGRVAKGHFSLIR